jgi:hypothetical protein
VIRVESLSDSASLVGVQNRSRVVDEWAARVFFLPEVWIVGLGPLASPSPSVRGPGSRVNGEQKKE